MIRLSPEAEPGNFRNHPRAWHHPRKCDHRSITRYLDLRRRFADREYRGAYPISPPSAMPPAMASLPSPHIIFLTPMPLRYGRHRPPDLRTGNVPLPCRLYGQVAGTEKALTSPRLPSAPAYGAAFYGRLSQRLRRPAGSVCRAQCQLLLCHTGWTGGPYAPAIGCGSAYTPAMVDAAPQRRIETMGVHPDPTFGVQVPTNARRFRMKCSSRGIPGATRRLRCPGLQLANMFIENLNQFEDRGNEQGQSPPSQAQVELTGERSYPIFLICHRPCL